MSSAGLFLSANIFCNDEQSIHFMIITRINFSLFSGDTRDWWRNNGTWLRNMTNEKPCKLRRDFVTFSVNRYLQSPTQARRWFWVRIIWSVIMASSPLLGLPKIFLSAKTLVNLAEPNENGQPMFLVVQRKP